jgi:hypothetical protein
VRDRLSWRHPAIEAECVVDLARLFRGIDRLDAVT